MRAFLAGATDVIGRPLPECPESTESRSHRITWMGFSDLLMGFRGRPSNHRFHLRANSAR